MSSFLEPWYAALESPNGVMFETNSPTRAKAKLYKARADANDPALASLSIVVSPTAPDSQLWIVKNEQ